MLGRVPARVSRDWDELNYRDPTQGGPEDWIEALRCPECGAYDVEVAVPDGQSRVFLCNECDTFQYL